jgi:hypothetical protein
MLESKHPDARIPDAVSLHQHNNTPDFVDVDVAEETVEKVARPLSGSAGVGGADSHALQHWLLRFGAASRNFALFCRESCRMALEWLPALGSLSSTYGPPTLRRG